MTLDDAEFNSWIEGKYIKEFIDSLPSQLRMIGANLTGLKGEMISALIAFDGFSVLSAEDWLLWRGCLIDLACDASTSKNILAVILRRCAGALSQSASAGQRGAECLSALGTLIPACSGQVMSVLEAACPYWKSSSIEPQTLGSFAQNALFLAESLPVLQDRIVDFLISSLVLPLDLHVQMENSKDDAKVEANEDEDYEALGEDVQSAPVSVSDKLDVILQEFKAFLERMSSGSDRFLDLSFNIIRIFEKTVLPALQPVHTCKIVLWSCQLNPQVVGRFLGFLTSLLFARDAQLCVIDPNGQAVNLTNNSMGARVLMTAACMLSRFIPFCTGEQRKSCLLLLLQWLERKTEAVSVYRQAVYVAEADYLNPIEVSICAAVWMAALRLLRVEDEQDVLGRLLRVAKGDLQVSLAVIEDDEIGAASPLLLEQKKALMAGLAQSKRRRERRAIQNCSFKTESYASYQPF